MMKNKEVSRDKKIEMQSINDNQFMVFTTDMSGKIIYCNDSFARAFKLDRKDIESIRSFIDFKHPALISLIYKDMWVELGEKGQWDGFLRKMAKDSEEFWIDTYIIKSMKDGKQIGYSGIAKMAEDSDITQAEELLYKKYGNFNSEAK